MLGLDDNPARPPDCHPGEQKENSYGIELLLISHSQSNGKAWFDKPFDKVYPEQSRRAQDKLRAGSPSRGEGALAQPEREGVLRSGGLRGAMG